MLNNNDSVRVFAVLVGSLTGSDAFYNGLQKANESFLKAIIRYSQFHEIHLFIGDKWLVPIRNQLKPYVDEFSGQRSIHFISANLLPSYLTRYEYEVFHKGDPYISDLAELRKMCARKPFVITGRAHTLCTDSNLSKTRDLVLSSLTKSDAVLCSSQAQTTVMETLLETAQERLTAQTGASVRYPGQLKTLPLGIDGDDKNHLSKLQARELLGYQPEQYVLLCVGRFSPADKMDLHPLLLVANDLLEEREIINFLVVLAGNGDAGGEYIQSLLRQSYDLNLEGRVRFELTIDDERKHLLYQAADVFISLADNVQESFGLAPLEAMNYSLPVILSEWNGYRELIAHGYSGFLIKTLSTDNDHLSRPLSIVEPEHSLLIEAQGTAVDLQSAVDIIEQLINDEGLRLAIGEAAKKRVMELFHWPILIKQYHTIIDSLSQSGHHLSSADGVCGGLSFQQAFKHYPSHILEDNDYLETTDRGVRVLLMDEKGFHFQKIHHLFEEDVVKNLVIFCLKGLSVRDIKQIFCSNNNLTFILLWMCKYQLLSYSNDKPCRNTIKQSTWWFQDNPVSNQQLRNILKEIEPQRAPYLSQVIGWIEMQVSSAISSVELLEGALVGSLLRSHIVLFDEKLQQAIAWFGQERGLADYDIIVAEIEREGGFPVLPRLYPNWFRLCKRMALTTCREIKRMCLRLAHDLPDINRCYGELWGSTAAFVTDVSLPLRDGFFSVCIFTFDNGTKLVYKARDMRIDHRIVNRSNIGGQSIAEAVNQWLDGLPGIGTHCIMPRFDKVRGEILHYGYAEYLDRSAADQVLTEHQAADYHCRIGVTSGLALMLGLADLHQMNFISLGDTPYLIDLEKAFQYNMFRFFEQELSNPSTAFIRGVTGSSFEGTGIPYLWQCFHSSRYRLFSAGLDGQILAGESFPVRDNIIKVGDRHSLDGILPALPVGYSDDVLKGFKAALTVICEYQEQWSILLDGCEQMQVGFQPLINSSDASRRLNNLHVFRGFQSFSHNRLKRYFHRSAMNICVTGQEVQRWYEKKWQEPMVDLSKALACEWLSGKDPLFVMYPGKPEVYVRTSSGGLKKVSGSDDYFSVNSIEAAKELLFKMASDDVLKNQFIESYMVMLKEWMQQEIIPGHDLPEEIRKQLLEELSA
ncbi:MAG: glycosyltransferase [Candidatus Endonucleobacter bathymodioli]|uniref:Glycosyltransferase n=1 Tax=Candidatus Endonucleibacter bathymodioli TaxID=539814 RepID=A0AA90NS82_9GAMM|nr:glycosyltransferase [Candidatus Endonucleobacter bathymodioli]